MRLRLHTVSKRSNYTKVQIENTYQTKFITTLQNQIHHALRKVNMKIRTLFASNYLENNLYPLSATPHDSEGQTWMERVETKRQKKPLLRRCLGLQNCTCSGGRHLEEQKEKRYGIKLCVERTRKERRGSTRALKARGKNKNQKTPM